MAHEMMHDTCRIVFNHLLLSSTFTFTNMYLQTILQTYAVDHISYDSLLHHSGDFYGSSL